MTALTEDPTLSAPSESPLAMAITTCEALWQAAISAHWPAAQCLHWGPWHRVFRFGDRVLKVQHLDHLPSDPRQHVRNEYELLHRLEGRAWRLHPTYQELDARWSVLAMDWIDGELLSETKGRSTAVPLRQVLLTVLRVSLAGVVHKQLRPRHVMCGKDGRAYLIDFGGSNRTDAPRALVQNFRPFHHANGKWRRSAMISVVRRALRPGAHQPTEEHAAAQAQWQANRQRGAVMRPPNLADTPGDPVAAEQFANLEQACHAAIVRDPSLALETWRLQWADYVLFGHQNLGLYAQFLAPYVSFANKRVVELAAGLAPISVLALLNGARAATAIEAEPELVAAGDALARGLGVNGINRIAAPPHAALAPDGAPAAGDIAVAVSPRLDSLPVDGLTQWFARFDEVLLTTTRLSELNASLRHRGFQVVDTLSPDSASRTLVYARRGRHR